MFETVIDVEKSRETLIIGEEPVDLDGLNYLAGQTVDFVNKFPCSFSFPHLASIYKLTMFKRQLFSC